MATLVPVALFVGMDESRNLPGGRARSRPPGSTSTEADRAWFERLYAAADAGGAGVPWDKGAPHHLLERRLRELEVSGDGRRALVMESLTVQSLPRQLRRAAVAQVRELVAPGGTLLVIAAVKGEGDDPPDGPWPLTRAEVESFAAGGLELVRLEDFRDPDAHRWRAELRRTEPPR